MEKNYEPGRRFGTIEGVLGEKRGLCLVHLVSHQGISIASDFYEGQKESEIILARNLLSNNKLSNVGVTLDALHCQTQTLELVVNQAGVYVVEVKANQTQLCADLTDHVTISRPTNTIQTYDKAHGRIEKRTYQFYNVSGVCFEPRWQVAHIQRLILVDPVRRCGHFTQIKTGKTSQERSFYITNSVTHTDQTLATALRGHWSIESGHWIRDVTYGEDSIRCSNRPRMKTLALLLSVAFSLTKQQNFPNIKAFHEDANAKPMIIRELLVHYRTP
jgi:predicted transposase YbfD/YdcC